MFEVLFVGHIFVINLVYGMFAFEAQTAEKIALKMGPSLPKKCGPGWKRAGIAGDQQTGLQTWRCGNPYFTQTALRYPYVEQVYSPCDQHS